MQYMASCEFSSCRRRSSHAEWRAPCSADVCGYTCHRYIRDSQHWAYSSSSGCDVCRRRCCCCCCALAYMSKHLQHVMRRCSQRRMTATMKWYRHYVSSLIIFNFQIKWEVTSVLFPLSDISRNRFFSETRYQNKTRMRVIAASP